MGAYWPLEPHFANVPEQFPAELKTFLSVQLAFYMSALFSIIVFESRRKDFVQMVVHHSNTIYLIVLRL